MSDSRTVNGSIKVQDTTKEEVAFKLMNQISNYEDSNTESKDRKYWLTLYRQCLKATVGKPLDIVLKQD